MLVYTLKNMVKIFSYIMAGMSICTATFISIFNYSANITVDILWQIIAIAAVCSMGNILYINHAVLTKRTMIIRFSLHYIYVNIVVIGGGFIFNWLTMDKFYEVVVMFFMIAVVYIIIMVVDFTQDKKTADSINQHLQLKYPHREE